MNCHTFRKYSLSLLDPPLDPSREAELRAHLGQCPACAREFEELQATLASLHPSCKVHASTQFKERVMSRISEMEMNANQSIRMGQSRWLRKFMMAGASLAACLMLLVGYNWFAARNGKMPTNGLAVLAQAAEVMRGLKTVHFQALVRTDRGGITGIKLDAGFMPLDIWVRYKNPYQWRIETKDTKIIMDGKAYYQIPARSGSVAIKTNNVVHGFGFFGPVFDDGSILFLEHNLAQQNKSDLKLTYQTQADGAQMVVLTIEAKAEGDFSKSDYLRNNSIIESDHIRVYSFDAWSHRLLRMQVFVKTAKGKVQVLETTRIEYDAPLDPSLFTVTEPQDTRWENSSDERAVIVDTASISPKRAAQIFFQALADENWDVVRQFCGVFADTPNFRKHLGGLKIIRIGEAFRSGQYYGWFIPYEIRFKNGGIKKFNLAMRNDNPKKQWEWDGGL